MQYRKMGKTGEEISALGYGCMRMPKNEDGTINVQLAKKQILTAIDNGVNYLDTAWTYHQGESEVFLGEHILKDGYREKVKIATKLPSPRITKPEEIEVIFEQHFKRLKVDVIDFYLLHTLNEKHFKKLLDFGIIDFMDKIKREGKVRYMGFSFHGSYDNFVEIIDSYDWDFCQIQYNILDEHFQAGIEGIKYAKSKGIEIFVMEPLRGGTLAGQMPKEIEEIYQTADVKRTPVDWALRWLYNHEDITMLLSGMNEEKQVLENIETASTALPNSLTEKEVKIISDVCDVFDKLMVVKCTGCGYCMPCPAGINIPKSLKSLNQASMFPEEKNKLPLTDGVFKPVNAENCINCGQCEFECPQSIKIREVLNLI